MVLLFFTRSGEHFRALEIKLEMSDGASAVVSVRGDGISLDSKLQSEPGLPLETIAQNLISLTLIGRDLYSSEGQPTGLPWQVQDRARREGSGLRKGVVAFLSTASPEDVAEIVLDDVCAGDEIAHPSTWKFVSTYARKVDESHSISRLSFDERLMSDIGMSLLLRLGVKARLP